MRRDDQDGLRAVGAATAIGMAVPWWFDIWVLLLALLAVATAAEETLPAPDLTVAVVGTKLAVQRPHVYALTRVPCAGTLPLVDNGDIANA